MKYLEKMKNLEDSNLNKMKEDELKFVQIIV